MSDIKILKSNIGYTTLLRLASSGLPFILYAYLFKTLSSDSMGIIVLMLAIAAILRVVVSFGFDVTGVKAIAERHKDSTSRLQYLNSVVFIQVTLWSLIAILSELYFYAFEAQLHSELRFVLIMLLGEIFWVKWFFQAKLKMNLSFKLTLISESGIFISTLLFVTTATDHQSYLALRSLTAILIGFLAIRYVYTVEGRVLIRTKLNHALSIVKKSFTTFSSRMIAVLHDELSSIIIASWLSMSQLATFDLARKLINLFCLPNSIINTVTFSHLTKTKDLEFAKRVFWFRNCLSILLIAMLVLFAPLLVSFFSVNSSDISTITGYLYLMSSLVLIRSVMYYTGTSLLVSFGYEVYFNRSVFITFTIYLSLISAAWWFSLATVKSIITIILISESFEALYRYVKCKRVGIL